MEKRTFRIDLVSSCANKQLFAFVKLLDRGRRGRKEIVAEVLRFREIYLSWQVTNHQRNGFLGKEEEERTVGDGEGLKWVMMMIEIHIKTVSNVSSHKFNLS